MECKDCIHEEVCENFLNTHGQSIKVPVGLIINGLVGIKKSKCPYEAYSEKIIDINTLERVIKTFGQEAQMIVALEELSELQKEITKHLRGKGNIEAMAEEIADVEIMLDQLRLICPDVNVKICKWKMRKLERIEDICNEADLEKITDLNDRM